MQTDLGLIIAILAVGVTIVGAIMGMMFWVRSEANALRSEQKEDRKDLLQVSRNLEITVSAIQSEIKDFHHRLLEIERNRSSKSGLKS